MRRVVSLVPSLTESVAATRRETLAGVTDWCTHPADLDVPRVRGTKNPNLAAIKALRPGVVLANQEENRRIDVERLRAAGVPVWVTVIETVDQAMTSLQRMFAALGCAGAGVARRRRIRMEPAGARRPDARRHPRLAGSMDGGGIGDLHRRRRRAARAGKRLRR